MKYLGVDYGRARVGIAFSDDDGKIAFPRKILPAASRPDLVTTICGMAKRESVGAMVIGLPRTIAGMDASLREEISSLAQELEEACKLPVMLQDEMLTTKIARKHSAKNVDAAAAALILQSFLDRKNRVSYK